MERTRVEWVATTAATTGHEGSIILRWGHTRSKPLGYMLREDYTISRVARRLFDPDAQYIWRAEVNRGGGPRPIGNHYADMSQAMAACARTAGVRADHTWSVPDGWRTTHQGDLIPEATAGPGVRWAVRTAAAGA